MFVFFLPINPVWAEMYRFKDKDGVVHFTDNLTDVSANQRQGMTVYENESALAIPTATELSSGQNLQSGQNLKLSEKSQTCNSTLDTQQPEGPSSDPSRINQLLKIKTALDEENAQFLKESLVLSEEKKTLSDNDSVRAYNDKVNTLNARVDDYEKRRAAFQKESDVFDAALKKRLAAVPPSTQPSTP